MILDICKDAGFLLRITVKIVKYMHIIVPILLVVLITYDLVKTLVGTLDDKAKKDAFGTAVKRLIYAVIVFLIPSILILIFNTLNKLIVNNDNTSTNASSWMNCWVAEYNK